MAPSTYLPPFSSEPVTTLLREKHILYWKRCLKTYLPSLYTKADANRMTLACFTLSALDLLSALESHTTPAERADYADWIYAQQHPNGGFRGFPATDLGERRNELNACWDPANVPATYFALAALAVLGDGLERVRRTECLAWLIKLQRDDGSFGETLGESGAIEGGRDVRFALCATGIRWILRGRVEGEVDEVKDVDTERLVECISRSQTYDGGISIGPYYEAHGGYAYCAIGALAFLDRLPQSPSDPSAADSKQRTGLVDINKTIRWLISRQTLYEEEEEDEREQGQGHDSTAPPSRTQTSPSSPLYAGYSGRPNKPPDTCYSFWIGASLLMLSSLHLSNIPANTLFLLAKTQHWTGGFGKQPGDLPDLHHSYLGLAGLALTGEEGLKKLWAPGCMSLDVARKVEAFPWRRELLRKKGWEKGSDLPLEAGKKKDREEGDSEEASDAVKQDRTEISRDVSYVATSGG